MLACMHGGVVIETSNIGVPIDCLLQKNIMAVIIFLIALYYSLHSVYSYAHYYSSELVVCIYMSMTL